MKYCRVKYVNNKCYWYEGDYQVGDLVYTRVQLSGVLGKVDMVSDRAQGVPIIIKKVGHIEMENVEDINELWHSLDRYQRERILKNLGVSGPCSKQKFRDWVGNTWTVAAFEGNTSWEQHLQNMIALADKNPPGPECGPKPECTGELIYKDGFVWNKVSSIPDREAIGHKELMQGVVYGTKEMIDSIEKECHLLDVTEYCNGIYRATTKDPSVIEKFPECKAAFFENLEYGMRALYSESGYPYFTDFHKKIHEYNHYNENEWIEKYYPDEIFRETTGELYGIGYFETIIFNAPFDKLFRKRDYTIEINGDLYQMNGIDLNNPPKTINKEWVYKENEFGIEICRYRGSERDLTFPTHIDGKKVIGIADRFGDIDNSYLGLESITIPLGYRYIGAYAFANCKKLKRVDLPESLISIRDGAFQKCTRLEDVTLPALVNRFYYTDVNKDGGAFIFFGCNNLMKVKSYADEIEEDRVVAMPKYSSIEYIKMSEERESSLIDWIINEFDNLVVYDYMTPRPEVTKGEKLYLVANEQGYVNVYKSDNRSVGFLVIALNGAQHPWLEYNKYVNKMNAVVTSEKYKFMAGYSFDIKLIRVENGGE